MGGSRKVNKEYWIRTKRVLLAASLLSVLPPPLAQGGEVRGSASVSSQQQAVLEALTPKQLSRFLAGTSPVNITLRSGESLAEFLERLGSGFELSWNTFDGGGSTVASIAGDFELAGTIGQPDAGPSAEADFELVGGFWVDLPDFEATIFGDGFESGDTSAWSGTVGFQQ